MLAMEVIFSEKQPDYRYFNIGDGLADVFIYKFMEERKVKYEDSDEESTEYIYEMNSFRIDSNEITEEMIKANPLDYLEYSNESVEISTEDRISAIESAIAEIGEELYK